jgi:dephospho-CoA kinase
VLRVGLTGGIGSGKTAVADRLAALGAVVVDADLLAREVVAVGTPGLADVVSAFGTEVLAEDGSLDRAAMGRLVFNDETSRRQLEAIIHPLVRAAAMRREADAVRADPDAVVVHVIPLLVETGRTGSYDVIIVVDVDPETQIERLVSLRGMDQVEAQQRIAAQASRAERLAIADEVIENNGTLAHLDAQVDAVWRRLTSSDAR